MTTFSGLVLAPVMVIGYHGCHIETAQRVLAGQSMSLSTNKYDWLGAGIYFWEYAPERAGEWARSRFGSDAAILMAEIRLGRCLNLLDTAYFESLAETYADIAERNRQAGRKMPVNRQDKRHYLDRAVIDEYCEKWARVGTIYQTVRGCFPEGQPLYEGSKILRETHVQIAVQDVSCILRVELVE